MFVVTTAVFSSEVFTLADGRVLTGTYSAEREELQLTGPIVATLHVTEESIVERKVIADEDVNDQTAEATNSDDGDAAERASDVEEPSNDNPERRAAQIQAALRTIDAAMAKRETSRQAILRRQGEQREALTKAQLALAEANTGVTSAEAELARNQSQIDEIKQARALSEIRLQQVTIETGTSNDRQRIDVVQAELSTADERLRELRNKSGALTKATTAAKSDYKKATIIVDRLTADIAKDNDRLAAYTKADEQDQERREKYNANTPGIANP
jgi:chromosome segregation ATPase